MAKKAGRPRSERRYRAVKIDQRIVGCAELLAKRDGVTLADYLSDILDGPVMKAFDRHMKRVAEEEELGS